MKKVISLDYIEDTKEQHKKICDLVKKASKEAILNAKQNNVAITYLRRTSIVSESPSGEITVIDPKIKAKGRKVVVGSKSILS